MQISRYFLIVSMLSVSFPAALGRMGSRQFSNELSNLGHWMSKAKTVEELDQVMSAWRLLFREQPLSPEESSLMMQLNELVVKKRARLAAIARVTLQKAGGPVVSPRPIVVTQPSVISTTTERLQARQLGTYPSVSFHGPRLPIASISSALPVEVKGSGTVRLLLTCFANLTLCSFEPPAALAAAAGRKPALSVTQAPVIEMPVSSFTISSPTASPTTARPVLVTAATTETASAKVTTTRPVLSTTASAIVTATKPTAAKPASPALVTNKTASVKSAVTRPTVIVSTSSTKSAVVKPSTAGPTTKKSAPQKTVATPSPPAVVTPGIFVKSSVRTPLSPLPAATVTPKVVKGKPASTVSEKRKGKVNGTSSVTIVGANLGAQATIVGKNVTSGDSGTIISPPSEKRAPPTTVVPHLNTTSSTTADPSFYIVSPYPVTDAPVDLSTLSTPRLESHWPDLYVHHDGQVVDQGYPWNLEKESDHALYEEWSRWRYNETEGVVHELSGSFGENLMPKRWPKTLPSQTPRPVVTGSVVVVDSDVVAVSNEETVVSPPAEKVNIAAAPPNVKWEHLPVVFLFCLCVSLAAALFVVLGKGGRPLFMREITSRRLDQVVDKEAAYDSGAEWDPEEDTDSVDEREEMPAKKVFRRKAPLATVRRGRLRGGQVDAAALSEFQRMTSVAGHQERFEPHSARKLAAAEKASEQELKRLMRGTAV
ncbi:hypothetical protein TYRP_020163 [Tyrophagus putrescentiae]|nr:hypothetical protein TYRP_020163 [Tyrophagus putrescentiae]